MSATPKRNAAPSGEGRGAKDIRQTQSDYRTVATTSTTAPTPATKDRRPWLGKDLTAWLGAVRATVRDADAGKVPHSMMTVAYSLALFVDHKEGTVYRAYPDLAADTGLSTKTVGALVRILEAHGHLETTRTATVGRAKQYRLTIPSEGVQDAELRKPASCIQEVELRKPASCIPVQEPEVIEEVPGHISGSPREYLRKPASTNKDTGLDKGATRPIINSTEQSTLDARACAPEGATAAEESIDEDGPPERDVPDLTQEDMEQWDAAQLAQNGSGDPDNDNRPPDDFEDRPGEEEPPPDDVPPEVRAQWHAEDLERYGHQSDNDDLPPDDIEPDEADEPAWITEQIERKYDSHDRDEDRAPEPHASEDCSEGERARAAPRAPVEEDDYFPLDLDEADSEPEPTKPPPFLPFREARILHAYAIHTIDEGADPVGRMVPVSVADEHANDDAWLLEVISDLVKKGFADHDAAASSVAVTAVGIAALWSTKWTDFPLVAKPIATSGEAKPITHKPVITDDDEHIPF